MQIPTTKNEVIYVGRSRGARRTMRRQLATLFVVPISHVYFRECDDADADAYIRARALHAHSEVVTWDKLRRAGVVLSAEGEIVLDQFRCNEDRHTTLADPHIDFSHINQHKW